MTREMATRWSELQQADPALASPYFRPEFTQAVASVRGDVEVAVMEQDDQIVGFFPYQRSRWNVAGPVGGKFSDYQGVIAQRGLAWDMEALLRACRLKAWHFDHLIVSQAPCRRYHRVVEESPYLDFSGGFEAYMASRLHASSRNDLVKQALRKARKLEREIGPLRFVPHTAEQSVFDTMIRWKSDQYRRSDIADAFAHEWTVALLRRIVDEQHEAFSGMMSALYVGDRLAAVHLGMRSGGLLHGWFPAYDQKFLRYSPGLILLVQLAKAAESLGIRCLDMGKGVSQYKRGLMSGAFHVAEGSVDLRPVTSAIRAGWRNTYEWMKSSPLKAPAAVPWRMTRRLRDWLAFH